MRNFIFALILFSHLFFLSCKDDGVFHNEWQELNVGYRFNPALYEKFDRNKFCIHDKAEVQHSFHRFFCTLYGYVPFSRLKYQGTSLSQVREEEGIPFFQYKDTLYYGYKSVHQGDPVFGISYFYDDAANLKLSQEFYRVSKILNISKCTITFCAWSDSTKFLNLYFLDSPHDTLAIAGFQTLSDFPFSGSWLARGTAQFEMFQ